MAVSTKASWLFPTNTENLQMMIAQGLVSDVSGFVGDYYKDILNKCPGFLPLFKSEVPLSAINAAKEESSDLTPCILKIDLSMILEGKCFHTRSDLKPDMPNDSLLELASNTISIEDIKGKKNDELDFESILIQGPLPLSCIDEVIFMSQADLNEFKSSTSNLGNVPTAFLSSRIQKAAFNHEIVDSVSSNELISSLSYVKVNYQKTYSLGGLSALAFYFSKNGVLSSEIFNSISELKIMDGASLEYQWILEYFYGADEVGKLQAWNAILDALNEYKKRNDNEFKNKIIDFLRSNPKTDDIANFLLEYHRSKIEKSDDTIISEYIKEYSAEPQKFRIQLILFMFFFKDSIEKLIKFHHDDFSETDYMLIGMLFGMNYGYIGTPKWLLEFEGLQLYISSVMANYAHSQANTGISFEVPEKPLTYTEMLTPTNYDFIERFAKRFDADLCFKTVLPKKPFYSEDGVNTYSGVVLAECKLVHDKYFELMSKLIITSKDYSNTCRVFRGELKRWS